MRDDVHENLDLTRRVIERCLDRPDLIDQLSGNTLTPAELRAFLARTSAPADQHEEG